VARGWEGRRGGRGTRRRHVDWGCDNRRGSACRPITCWPQVVVGWGVVKEVEQLDTDSSDKVRAGPHVPACGRGREAGRGLGVQGVTQIARAWVGGCGGVG
jgi:hypothetical protein